MPRFFFDYRDSDGQLERDCEGIEFPSLEAAYEDVLKAAVAQILPPIHSRLGMIQDGC